MPAGVISRAATARGWCQMAPMRRNKVSGFLRQSPVASKASRAKVTRRRSRSFSRRGRYALDRGVPTETSGFWQQPVARQHQAQTTGVEVGLWAAVGHLGLGAGPAPQLGRDHPLIGTPRQQPPRPQAGGRGSRSWIVVVCTVPWVMVQDGFQNVLTRKRCAGRGFQAWRRSEENACSAGSGWPGERIGGAGQSQRAEHLVAQQARHIPAGGLSSGPARAAHSWCGRSSSWFRRYSSGLFTA